MLKKLLKLARSLWTTNSSNNLSNHPKQKQLRVLLFIKDPYNTGILLSRSGTLDPIHITLDYDPFLSLEALTFHLEEILSKQFKIKPTKMVLSTCSYSMSPILNEVVQLGFISESVQGFSFKVNLDREALSPEGSLLNLMLSNEKDLFFSKV